MCLRELWCLGKSDFEGERSPDRHPKKIQPSRSDHPPHKRTEVSGNPKGNTTAKAPDGFLPKSEAEAARQAIGSKAAPKITDSDKQPPLRNSHKGEGRTEDFQPKGQENNTISGGGDDDHDHDDEEEKAEKKTEKNSIRSDHRASKFGCEE